MSRPTLQSTPYTNCRVLSPAGVEMFHCGDRKKRWYLDRGLAVTIPDRPDTIRLTFEPNGPGHAGDTYYLTPKDNVCVACGATRRLTRHHVVPFGYRRHFPDRVKRHNYHDVVLLCASCHTAYETHAATLKDEIGREFGVPAQGTPGRFAPELVCVRKAACALHRYGDRIPDGKRAALRQIVRDHLGRDPEPADLLTISALDLLNPDFCTHGEVVARALSTDEQRNQFVKRWRCHFLAVMQPTHMPAHWNPDRPAHEHWHVDKAPA